MSDQIRFEGLEDEIIPGANFVKIKDIKSVYSIDSIGEHFEKELKTLAMEELIQIDGSISQLMQQIKRLRPNMVVVQRDAQFICVDTEVNLGPCILVRNKKMIATGTYSEMQQAACIKLKKEWSGKMDRLQPEEIDEEWLSNFCKIHYGKENIYRIIQGLYAE